jgi:hypothetical protein
MEARLAASSVPSTDPLDEKNERGRNPKITGQTVSAGTKFFVSWGPRFYHAESNDVFKIAHVAEFILREFLHPSF